MTSASTDRAAGGLAAQPEPERPLRADAERNRARVLAAARTVLCRHGLDATTTDEVAKVAGVGVGTVYRRFPTKESLVAAALTEMADAVLADVAEYTGEPDPERALRGALEALASGLHANRGVIDAVVARLADEEPFVSWRAALRELLGPVFARAHAAGVLREDVVVEDVPAMLVAMVHFTSRRPGVDPELWRRYLGVLLDGLRPGGATPLPLGPPPG